MAILNLTDYIEIEIGGGIIIYVSEDIPSRMLTKHNFPENIEGLFVELNFRKTK